MMCPAERETDNYARAIKERLDELVVLAEEDADNSQEPIRDESRAGFDLFMAHYAMPLPSLVLTPHGNIRARWEQPGAWTSITFLDAVRMQVTSHPANCVIRNRTFRIAPVDLFIEAPHPDSVHYQREREAAQAKD